MPELRNLARSGKLAGALAAALLLAPACSLIYDPGAFEGGADAGQPDADPCPALAAGADLEITVITPAAIDEGMGGGEFAPPIPILLRGEDIAPDATITIDDEAIEVGEAMVSCDRTMVATTIRIPVDPQLGSNTERQIPVRVSQGEQSEFVLLTIRGLDERVFIGGNLATEWAGIQPRYSRVEFTGAVHFGGDIPARIVATAEIVVNAPVDADGALSGTPGTAACDGGEPAGDGDCGPGGGRAGGTTATAGGGGGGGASSEDGQPGEGASGGAGGLADGTSMLVPLDGARGHGGGGGGPGSGGAGGQGGGGGGIIELTSFGDLHINEALRAAGGPGGPGQGTLCSTHGGGGGGGGGGGLLLRAHGQIFGTETPLSAAGGGGGQDQECEAGGAGSPGRIRIDNHDVSRADLAGAPGAILGPMWGADMPQLVDTVTPALPLVGQPGRQFGYAIDGGSAVAVTTDAGGGAAISPTLTPGLHTICLLVAPSVSADLLEGKNCRTIAVLP